MGHLRVWNKFSARGALNINQFAFASTESYKKVTLCGVMMGGTPTIKKCDTQINTIGCSSARAQKTFGGLQYAVYTNWSVVYTNWYAVYPF